MTKIRLHLILIFLFSSSVLAKDIMISSSPVWVYKTDFPENTIVSKYDVRSGAYYKLIDHQMNFEDGLKYHCYVQNILTSGGVTNASQLKITYDSAYQ